MPTSSSHYFREAIDAAERNGLDAAALLAAVGLSDEQIRDPNWRGEIDQLAHVVQLSVEALDDEFMGFLDDRSKPGTFAMMTYLIASEPTMEKALRQGIRYYSLFTDAMDMSLESTPDGATWTVQWTNPDVDETHYYLEFWLSIWYRLLLWLSGGELRLLEASFSYPLAGQRAEELELLFRCPLLVDAPVTSLHFPQGFLRRPLLRSRAELKQFLANTPLGVMRPTTEETRVARRVLSIVQTRDGGALNFPPFKAVAAQLFMTEQTLRRRLRDESTSYRAIKESVRRSMAEELLRDSGLTVQELSHLIGYTEPRAFTRAFQHWTGMSPSAYRAEVQDDNEAWTDQ